MRYTVKSTTNRNFAQRALFEHANDGILLLKGSRFLKCNQRLQDILKRPEEQILGNTPWDISPPTQPDGSTSENRAHDFIHRGLTGERQLFEWVHTRGDSSLVSVEVSLSLITHTDPPLILCHVRDIRDRLRTEEALRSSEEHYRRVVEDQTDFIVRWLPDGTRIFVNDAYCRYFGQSREVLLGTNFLSLVAPEDRARAHRKIFRQTPENPIAYEELRAIRHDGASRWQRWLDRAFFNDNGDIVELQPVGRDIHDQKALQDALRASEEKYAKAFRSRPSAILISRVEDGTIVEANKGFERLTGYLKEDISGKSTINLGLWADLSSHGVVLDYEIEVRMKSGEIRDCLTSEEIVEVKGTPCIVTLTQDITEAKAANAALRHQANHDHLTGLPNRYLLTKKIEAAIAAPEAKKLASYSC